MSATSPPRETERVLIPRGRAVVLAAWLLGLLLISPLIVLFLLVLGRLVDIVRGIQPMDPAIVVGAAALAVLLAALITGIHIGSQSWRRPDVFTARRIRYGGNSYRWYMVERLYANPDLSYGILLFRGLEGPDRRTAGLRIEKKHLEPSWTVLVDLARLRGVEVAEAERFTVDDLAKLEARRVKDAGLEDTFPLWASK